MNYVIENNINFFAELKNALNNTLDISNSNNNANNNANNDDNADNNNDDEICLLTHQPLEENFITMVCKHKFNYIPLYNEICRQKQNNYLETTHLLIHQMKCPYCRTITNKILPFITDKNVMYKRGVNYPQKYCMTIHTCTWTNKSGKNKNNMCGKPAYKTNDGIYCSTHHNMCNRTQKKLDQIQYINDNWTDNHEKINKKYNIHELKELLRNMNTNNQSKHRIIIGGTKKELIHRVLMYELANF